MAAPILNAKFLRSFYLNPAPSPQPGRGHDGTGNMGWVLRLLFEFWGFCVNGSNDLINPGSGSFATTAGSAYYSMPIGWASGSTVLLASGSDGTTSQGIPIFTVTGSTPFSPNMVGKWLTMWQSGSILTDDSIYLITSWVNSSSVYVDPTYGGTPVNPVNNPVPQLTTRSNINYRVVDYLAASNLTYTSGDYYVVQFSNASNINPGQVRSQARIRGNNSNGVISANGTITMLGITLSPSGTWNGTSFTGENYTETFGDGNILGPGQAGGPGDYFQNSGGGTGWVTIIAGQNFLICQFGSPSGQGMNSDGGSCFVIEIPQRLYPQSNDPNPICNIGFGSVGVGVGSQVGYGYGSRWFPSPYDTLTRRWPILSRSPTGSYWNFSQFGSGGSIQGANVGRWELFYNKTMPKFMMSDGILSMVSNISGQASAVGQFSLARARVLTMRFTSGNYPYYMRVGDDNDRWIHAGGGVLWPWDHAVVWQRPLFAGF